ncbi:MAG: AAA family ATPase [Oscillospiraceae bacterium]
MSAYIIGVSGGSGSGKSTFCQALLPLLPQSRYLSVDSHYKKELPTMISPLDKQEYPDWNHPDTVNLPAALQELEEAEKSSRFVVVDGAFLFCLPELNAKLHYRIFIDATIEMRLYRRIRRNLEEKGQSLDFIAGYYLNCARFREKEYCLPSRAFADLIVDNESGFHGKDREAAKIILENSGEIVPDSKQS